MVLEAERATPCDPKKNLQNVEIYAALPTVSDSILTYNSAWESGQSPKFRTGKETIEQRSYGIKFHRPSCTDEQLLIELGDELKLRRIDITSPSAHVAIVSEWDTYYGRALPITFAAVASKMSPDSFLSLGPHRFNYWPNSEPSSPWNRIHVFHYMRGLDGRIPGGEKTKKSEPQAAKTKNPHAPPPERPDGQNQFDYLVRLAEDLESRDRSLLHTTGTGIQAVGVLGSDVYDKLLVLRALRPRLQRAVFFTNGLDARLAQPQEWPATHNLIVVSSFGLQLNPALQRQVPPFRDTYQTALYAATLRCLGVIPDHVVVPPQRFEVGRTRPYNLSSGTSSGNIQQPRDDLEPWWNRSIVGKLALLLLMAVALTTYSHRVIRGDKNLESLKRSPLTWITATALASAAFIWILVEFQGAEGERFTLVDGISVWPSNALRLFAAFLSIYFIVKSQLRMEESNNSIAAKYGLSTKDCAPPVIHEFRQEHDASPKTLKPARGKVCVRELWSTYIEAGRAWERFLRILPPSVAYFLFSALLLWFFGWPLVPTRGEICHTATVVIEVLASFLAIVLTFYVLDATRLGVAFVHRLTDGNSAYPNLTFKIRHTNRASKDASVIVEEIDIQLIADTTEALSPLIYYPFVVAFLMIVSRINHFDTWDWSLRLSAVYIAILGYAIYSVFRLRRCAEVARSEAIEKVNQRLIIYISRGLSNRAEIAREVIKYIQDVRTGAFATLARHPVFGALMLPSSGISIWVLLQYLSKE